MFFFSWDSKSARFPQPNGTCMIIRYTRKLPIMCHFSLYNKPQWIIPRVRYLLSDRVFRHHWHVLQNPVFREAKVDFSVSALIGLETLLSCRAPSSLFQRISSLVKNWAALFTCPSIINASGTQLNSTLAKFSLRLPSSTHVISGGFN